MKKTCDHAQPYLPEYSICRNPRYYLCTKAVSFADLILCRQMEPLCAPAQKPDQN